MRDPFGRPLLLDLFCGAGGAAKGYYDAGFQIIGVDIERQPNYPYVCMIRDITEPGMLEDLVSWLRPTAIHASPPCQAYSMLNAFNGKEYADLVGWTRERLTASGVPWVIENVPQAPLIDPMTLCGGMFGLRLKRHRGFESNMQLIAPPHQKHQKCARNGNLPTADQPWMTITGGKHSKAWTLKACEYMGCHWMTTTREVCESIPPRYTEWVGQQLLAQIEIPPIDLGWMSL